MTPRLRGLCEWPEPFGRVGLGLPGAGPQATEKRVKITDGWGGSRHVLFLAGREGSEKHCRGSMMVGRALTCFAPEPQVCREGSEKHCWGSVGCARSGVSIDLSAFFA